ncbi:hypothetical protein EWZ88_02495 [Helicobacter pylori]|nr:hypothetical protein [Helicobacter pylori]
MKLFPEKRYIPHATNHKSTTATEKIKCANARNPLNIKCWSVSFFLFVKGVYQSVDSVLMLIKQ